jgi:glycosyltransferase involved in cell wall biosynthesis
MIAVVIPCYRVTRHIADVIRRIGPEVSLIVCVDDGCPDGSGAVIEAIAASDPRVHLARHEKNMGVGAAVLTGYRQAISQGADVVVKLDGDGQMAPEEIPCLIGPILRGEADYAKGNRFFNLDDLHAMPWVRLIGNAGLSLLSKLSSGYWSLFDPTNGFTAIHARVAAMLPFEKLSKRYFFESDMLFRLNTLRAVVVDVPVKSRYADEKSSLSITKTLIAFPVGHFRNLGKRIFYNYFLRDFNAASLNLLVGLTLAAFGLAYGMIHWIRDYQADAMAAPGTVMLAALPIILGMQALLSFVNYDVISSPAIPLHPRLEASPASSQDETADNDRYPLSA